MGNKKENLIKEEFIANKYYTITRYSKSNDLKWIEYILSFNDNPMLPMYFNDINLIINEDSINKYIIYLKSEKISTLEEIILVNEELLKNNNTLIDLGLINQDELQKIFQEQLKLNQYIKEIKQNIEKDKFFISQLEKVKYYNNLILSK